MNWNFGNILSGITGIGSLFSGGAMNRRSIRYAQQENETNRNFQAQQAELSRDWQEEMYNKYYSPSAQMASFQQAGINPAMAVGSITGNGSVSAPSASGGSSIGISQENPWQGAQTALSSAFDSMRLKNETIKLNYETNLLKEQAANLIADTLVKGETLNLTKTQISVFNKSIEKMDKEIELLGKEFDLKSAQIDALKQEFENLKIDNSLKSYELNLKASIEAIAQKHNLPLAVTERLLQNSSVSLGYGLFNLVEQGVDFVAKEGGKITQKSLALPRMR